MPHQIGKRVMLTGQELENANVKYGTEIEKQNTNYSALKQARSEISNVMSDLSKEPENEQLKEKLREKNKDFFSIRFQDDKFFTPDMKIWQEAFVKSMEFENMKDAKRRGSIAIDVLQPYLSDIKALTFKDLLNGKTVDQILNCFDKKSKNKSNTKIKYINIFRDFITFLAIDSMSPERKSDFFPLTDMQTPPLELTPSFFLLYMVRNVLNRTRV